MILSDNDLRILREFLLLKSGSTTWRIMKRIHPEGGNKEHMMIIRALKKMFNKGLFFKEEREYILNTDIVKFNKIPKMETFISFKSSDNKWRIIEM